MILSLSARVSPCFILILFLSKHFMAYLTLKQQQKVTTQFFFSLKVFFVFSLIFIGCTCSFPHIFPVSAFLQPYTSPKPPLPMIRWTLKSFMVSWRWRKEHKASQKWKGPFRGLSHETCLMWFKLTLVSLAACLGLVWKLSMEVWSKTKQLDQDGFKRRGLVPSKLWSPSFVVWTQTRPTTGLCV